MGSRLIYEIPNMDVVKQFLAYVVFTISLAWKVDDSVWMQTSAKFVII